ncbi:MAG: ABC transporter ATP-binding protein [Candidatus Methanomethyliaceae archaeon]|nr:ABC transporter ATP-binding protein [Candidatus Methanomethyliaceae archaeon]MDW7971530.1 ABC transporter ATP-binding protein [Nitrososphaerota archaeon]
MTNSSSFSNNIVLCVKDIKKVYPNGVVANDGVSFSLLKGEIHSILGENGAGKTTLIKIITGCITPDSGEIYVHGNRVNINSPMDAINLKIGVIHQHFTLIPSLTVAENIALSLPLNFSLDLENIKKKIRDIAKSINLEINPDAKIEELSVGLRQRVEIIKILCQDAEILIFDEPTSVLTPLEVKKLFSMIRELKSRGKSIILITHKVKEALSISDRITIMRRGRIIKTLTPSETNEDELAFLIVGDVRPSFIARESNPGEPLLIVKNLKVLGDRKEIAVNGVSFFIRSGEIVGIAGVAGNGQKELVEALTGLRRVESGSIIFKGMDLTNKSPRFIIRSGIAYIPEDRIRRGVIPNLSVAENLILKSFDSPPYSRSMIMNRNIIESFAQNLINIFGIVTPNSQIAVRNLSGGNIQKLIVARELSNHANVLIAENPSAGLDVRSTETLHQMLSDLRSKGIGILLISADLDEILKLSDRVLIMFNGRIVGELDRNNIDMNKVAKLMLGAT